MEWTKASLKPVQYIMKGSNSFTEHYSALKAEFELSYDPTTRYVALQNLRVAVYGAYMLLLLFFQLEPGAGRHSQARRQGGRVRRSHLTLRELHGARLGGCVAAERIHDLVILTDCASPVPGFEEAGEVTITTISCLLLLPELTSATLCYVFPAVMQEFLRDMAAKGLTLTTSDKFTA
ncbi:hypothetical protein AM588_10008485 [Phytophthora nicotianae]|uniref:Uncharacterized protein n=1 Tax=Phytophthora nicotianae TaxID=4792 RepID=A0A0W8DM14_PHYNI|nr:hypothetical protein AM588_10008485 [Phytophthora nicotianae]